MTELMEPPRVLRIRAGDVVVELEWADLTAAGPRPTGTDAVAGPAVAVPEPAEPEAGFGTEASGLVDICAPTVGTFYRAPDPGAGPFVSEGDLVRRGQQIGIVEAMKLMIPLEAEYDGHVVAVLIADGTPVEYGDRLFTFAPTAA